MKKKIAKMYPGHIITEFYNVQESHGKKCINFNCMFAKEHTAYISHVNYFKLKIILLILYRLS